MISQQSRTAQGNERGRPLRAALLGLAAAVVPALGLGPPSAGAASVPALGSLQSAPCTVKAGDPPIEAPLYAQQLGASPRSDGWWCQLPHATQIPSALTELRRDVAPLPNNHALYETIFTPRGLAFGTSLRTKGLPYLIVSEQVDSSIAPNRATHTPQFSSGPAIELKPGVRAYVSVQGNSTAVTFAYPSNGVPKYLFAVTYVTVSGANVPLSTVVAVAKKVRPM